MLTAAGPALAHSELTGIDVKTEAAGGGAPASMVLSLSFSEAVDPGFGRLDVVGPDGRRLEVTEVAVTDDLRHLTARVAPPPPAGVYTIGWFVRSRDGDASNGSSELTVPAQGGQTAVLPPVNARDPAWQPPMTWRMTTVSALLRWLNYLGAALFVGTLLFRLLVWPAARNDARSTGVVASGGSTGEGGRRDAAARAMPGFQALLFAGLGSMFFANILLLLLQASFLQLATLQPVDNASPIPLDPSGLQRARTGNALGEIFGTFAGGVWIVRMALIAALAPLVWRLAGPRSERNPTLLSALLGGLGLLLTISLSAHAAFVPVTFSRAATAVLIDWTHLVAMSLWLGGLLPLLLALRGVESAAGGPNESGPRLLNRFSALALGSVAYLALSGLASSYFQVGDPSLLVRTVYGVTLSVKLALVAVLVALGALNRFVLIPRVRETRLAGGFSRSLPVEIGFGLLLLFSVAMLASQGAAATAWPAHRALGLAEQSRVGDTAFLLRIAPGETGTNAVAIDVTDQRAGAWRTEGVAVISLLGSQGTEWATERLTFANTLTERFLVPGAVLLEIQSGDFRVRLERPGYEPIVAEFGARLRDP